LSCGLIVWTLRQNKLSRSSRTLTVGSRNSFSSKATGSELSPTMATCLRLSGYMSRRSTIAVSMEKQFIWGEFMFAVATASIQGKCTTAGPLDACKTPTPAGPQPLPYPNMGMCSDGSGSSKVKVKGKEALRKGDKLSKSMLDNAGTIG